MKTGKAMHVRVYVHTYISAAIATTIQCSRFTSKPICHNLVRHIDVWRNLLAAIKSDLNSTSSPEDLGRETEKKRNENDNINNKEAASKKQQQQHIPQKRQKR